MIQSVCQEAEGKYSFQQRIDMAEEAEFDTIVDVNDDCFLTPERMIREVKDHCRTHELPVPETPGQLPKCVCRSPAVCCRDAIRQL